MYCSIVSRDNGEDPIGTAPAHMRYLCVEVPLPWESKAEQSKHFPHGLTDLLKAFAEDGIKCRLQPFTSDTNRAPEGMRRVMFFEREEGPFATYAKCEYIIQEDQLLPLTEALLQKKSLAPFASEKVESGQMRDIFVCTHGSRDRCCGKFSYPIYKAIADNYATNEDNNIRVWRASHIGGHRHAPTLFTMPEGRYWAQITEDDLDALVLHKGDVHTLEKKYRGWGGVKQIAQVAERALFMQEGWDWLTYDKEAKIVEETDISTIVHIRYKRKNDPSFTTYEAEVTATKTVRTGGCDAEPKDVKQYEVKQLAPLA